MFLYYIDKATHTDWYACTHASRGTSLYSENKS